MLKKIILAVVVLSTVTFALSADTKTSTMYYQTLRILKIYPMKAGYQVAYLTPVGTVHDTYIPISWFGTGTGKAVLVAGQDPAYPYMAVYWNNDKFDYVILYVKSNPSDSSWGEVPQGYDPVSKFPTNGQLSLKWN